MRLTEIAPLISAAAFVFSAVVIMVQLRNVRRDRFVTIANQLFNIWQSPDFMEAQLWIINELEEKSWDEFKRKHKGGSGERALWRVGGFYNRIGTMVQLGLVDERAILRTTGWTAYAVWQKIGPLMEGARQENPTFLADFEYMLPFCKKSMTEIEMPQKIKAAA